jgi:hypothetical protein
MLEGVKLDYSEVLVLVKPFLLWSLLIISPQPMEDILFLLVLESELERVMISMRK